MFVPILTPSRSGDRRLPVSLLLSVAGLALFLVPGAAGYFQINGSTFTDGELWRLVTCHWTHWNLDHLVWDLSAFAGLGYVCERLDRASFLRTLWLSAITISLGLPVLAPEIAFYRGLSGIDAALFALLAMHLMRRSGIWGRCLGAAGILGFLGKVIFEWATGQALFVGENGLFATVPEAHLIGAVSGVLAGIPLAGFFRDGHKKRPYSRIVDFVKVASR